MSKRHTLCVFSENSPGVLQRISGLMTRRRLNIESLTVSETEKRGISRFTIVLEADRDLIDKVAKQIHRIIEVLDVYVCEDSELISKEIALYKITTKSAQQRENALRLAQESNARIPVTSDRFIVIEKTGSEEEIRALFTALEPLGIVEFVRSGRIALLKADRSHEEDLQEERVIDSQKESQSMF